MYIKACLGIVTTPYYYDEFKLSDKGGNIYIDDVVEEYEQAELINQILELFIPEFKDVNGSTHMKSFDWALSLRNSNLTTKLKVGQIFWTKAILINTLKRWHVKSSLQYKVQHITTTYVQLQYKHELAC